MGDGKKLKEHIDNKGNNVRKIAKETGISATTLYTIIQKDSWMMKPGKRLWRRYNLSCNIIRMRKGQNR